MIEGIITPGMGTNCYLLSCPQTKKAILIDPGAGSKGILDWLKQKDVEISFILLTHGHYDHIGAVEDLRQELGVEVAVHEADAGMLVDPMKNLSGYMGKTAAIKPAEIILQDQQVLELGNLQLQVIHTPGHTPGSICLLTPDGLISGDTLFNGSVGRTDFPGGNMNNLLNSIQERIMVLDDDINVYPGHESITTIGKERLHNPFLNGTY